MHQAWHIAALTRSKKMPTLKSLLISEEIKPKHKQTPEEMYQIVARLNKALGGSEL
jgi:hypothetical protein